jgi:hypothetical protein
VEGGIVLVALQKHPPYPGMDERPIAATKPPKTVFEPGISLDGEPSVRLQTRGQP